MSRGPGVRQRLILAAIAENGYCVITFADDTATEQVAYRRAAYSLQRAGKTVLVARRVNGTSRLVAFPAESGEVALGVLGRDGKVYRTVYGATEAILAERILQRAAARY